MRRAREGGMPPFSRESATGSSRNLGWLKTELTTKAQSSHKEHKVQKKNLAEWEKSLK
jgi:hypothetical protein